jgi:hypothetical protein
MLPVNATAGGCIAGPATVMFSVASFCKGLAMLGENVTLIVQLASGFRVAPQPPVCAVVWLNWLALAPPRVMLDMPKGAVPVFLTVTVCNALVVFIAELNVSAAGEKFAIGMIPVPLNATVRGLPGSAAVIVRVPASGPLTVGANLTLIVQLLPPARLGVQFWPSEKFGLEVTLETAMAVVPTLVSVMF